jgi:hypothetical protein
MNFNMDLWETTEAKEFGEVERLELGGHEIVIRDAREYTSELSGNTSLRICVDIGGNDKQKGFFQRQFDENTSASKKWSNGATKYVLTLSGKGLWGGIGGYLALDADKNTIYGVNFNHASETPGLGAKIVEMEQSGCIAVAQFRGFDYGALVYGGDDVSQEEWSNRAWRSRQGIRYDLVMLCKDLVENI